MGIWEKPYTQLRNYEKIFINGYLVIAGIIIVFCRRGML